VRLQISLTSNRAREILEKLADKFPHRFIRTAFKGEIYMIYNVFDDTGTEFTAPVYIRPSRDNSRIILEVKKRDLPPFIRNDPHLEEDIIDMFKSYLRDVVSKGEVK
jgi:hypothetical protein